MKYLLDVPDEEMAEWKALAKGSGIPFAEWLRHAIRDWVRDETGGRPVSPPSRSKAGRGRIVAVKSPTSADLAARFRPDFKHSKK